MENLADALKIVLAVLIFVIALSITFFLMTQMKDTSDTLLWYSDKTNYWTETMVGSNDRVVGVDTVITTLKNRVSQSLYVTVIETNIVDGNNEYTYSLSETDDEKVENYIKEHISGLKSSYTYKETVREITTDGTYKIADDSTKIAVKPGGQTRRYIIYEKQ